MPDTRISDLTVLTAPAAGDLIPIVDISDTTMAASGTTKRVAQSVLLASVQPLDATLTALAGLTIAADSLAIGTGADAFTQTTFAANTLPARASTGSLGAKPITDFGLSLIDDAADSNARTTLGLGTLATQSGTFSGTSSGTNSGDQTISLTGDVTGSGTGSFATTLATVATAGTTGGSTAIPVVTINAKGLTTGITTAAVIAPAGTLSGATLASNVLASSLTSVGTLAAVAITGGAINGATVGATTPATGAFTSLSSTIGANLATSSGNVGIGTASPGASLDVYTAIGASRTTPLLKLYGLGGATSPESYDFVNWGSDYGPSSGGLRVTTAGSVWGSQIYSSGALSFNGNGYSNAAPAVLINSLGNMGIGTASPGARLQVSSGAAGTIGEIIKGAASQTANLTEWQNSSATVLACVTAAGNVGIGTSSPNANAILDVTSTTKAFMPPRMTTTQKNAIASPTSGMVVYDSTLNKLSLYGASAWQTVTSV